MTNIARALPARTVSEAPPIQPISKTTVKAILRLADFCVIGLAATIAYWIWLVDRPSLDWSSYVMIGLIGALLSLNLFQITHVYRWETLSAISVSVRSTLLAWGVVVGILVVIAFLTKTSDQFSRSWLLLWAVISAAFLILIRVFVYLSILQWQRDGRLRRTVAVYGAGPIGRQLVAWLRVNGGPECELLGVFDDRARRRPGVCAGIPVLGNSESLIDFVRRRRTDMVIVALPLSAVDRLEELFDKLSVLPVDVRLSTDAIGRRLGAAGVSVLGNMPLLNVCDRPLSDWRWAVKNIEDKVLTTFILLLIAPLMLLIAVAIKLDSRGPVLFRQNRYGFNNQLIEVFKFRTMYEDKSDQNADRLTRRNDPRVTRVGAFLRRTSLDELPQFINVLRGDMSIVGPRPHASRAKAGGVLYQDAVRKYAARHRVKPGITGWAQINGWRGETETLEQIEKRVEHDLAYIENWSLWLDLAIIVRTAFTGFIDRQAY